MAAAVQGTYEVTILGSDTVRMGVLIATDSRIVFYAKKLGGYDLESFPFGNVSSFEQSRGMMGHSISFFASGNKVTMKWINDAAAMQRFALVVRASMQPTATPTRLNIPGRDVAQPVAPTPAAPSANNHASIIDAIARLGDLYQAGVLSQDEFSAKKAELLARL